METQLDAPPIQVRGVSHFFGRGALRKQILFDVETDVERGEIVILTGPSGSGKTTLLTLIGALRTGQKGSVKILSQEIVGARNRKLVSVRRQIGYIFQTHNLLPALTAEQNVRMALQLSGRTSKRKARPRIEEVLERVGLAEHMRKLPAQLSGGQRQRVAIARALVARPSIILADEPTASLDKKSGRDVVDLIQQLAREDGASVVLVTHDNRILDVADRILHLEDGCIMPLSEAVASEGGRMLDLLAEHDPEAHRTLVTFAMALARVAHADRRVDEEELVVIRQVLGEIGGLGSAEIEFVLQLAIAHDGAIASDLPAELKARLLASMRAVAEADGALTAPESEEIDRVAHELGFTG